MFVRVIKQYEKPYKTADIDDIEPARFAEITVDGMMLSELVAKKLDEILSAAQTSNNFP